MVTRVSPAPGPRVVPFLPPPWGAWDDSDSDSVFTVRDGYLWTMDDPPGSDPEVVHHDAEVVHHDAVRHVFAHVSGTWAVAEHRTNGVLFRAESGEFSFPEADLGEGWTPRGTQSFQGPDGASVWFSPSTGGWRVTLPSVSPSDPSLPAPFDLTFTDGSSSPLAVGSTSSGSGSGSAGLSAESASASVYLEVREVVPAWDEVESDSWDELVAPPATRKVSYLGDW